MTHVCQFCGHTASKSIERVPRYNLVGHFMTSVVLRVCLGCYIVCRAYRRTYRVVKP